MKKGVICFLILLFSIPAFSEEVVVLKAFTEIGGIETELITQGKKVLLRTNYFEYIRRYGGSFRLGRSSAMAMLRTRLLTFAKRDSFASGEVRAVVHFQKNGYAFIDLSEARIDGMKISVN